MRVKRDELCSKIYISVQIIPMRDNLSVSVLQGVKANLEIRGAKEQIYLHLLEAKMLLVLSFFEIAPDS